MSNLIYKKMSDVMKEVGFVAKAQTNVQQGFKFRGIDQFINALYPALTKHGVFMAPRSTSFTQELKDVVRSSGKPGVDKHVAIQMEYDFWAEDGSKVTIGPIPAEGLDSGDKATNKALSAALKYALIQTFSIPTVDMAEADLESPEIGTTRPTVKETVAKHYPITATPIVENTSTPAIQTISTETPKKSGSFSRKKKETNIEQAAKETIEMVKELTKPKTISTVSTTSQEAF